MIPHGNFVRKYTNKNRKSFWEAFVIREECLSPLGMSINAGKRLFGRGG